MVEPTVSSVEAFTTKMLDLLNMEREAELEESSGLLSNYSFKELEKQNLAITKLFVKSVSTGVYGRVLLHLTRGNKQESSEEDQNKLRSFSSGDIVGVFESGAGSQGGSRQPSAEGLVYRVTNSEIVLTFNQIDDFENYKQPLNIVLLANEITYQRCKMAIDLLAGYQNWKNQRLVDVLFQQEVPSRIANTDQYSPEILNYRNLGLNQAQKAAISNCLCVQDLAMIHGPPGTGKTTTVVEFIVQTVELQKSKVLACAPSNIAVDNIIERLHVSNPKLRIVRIGHPARLLESVQKFCLDALVMNSNDYSKATLDIKKQLQKLALSLNKKKTKQERYDIQNEFKNLRKDLRQIEQQHIFEILGQADVICSTLTSASDKTLRNYIHNKLPDNLFDVLVIDECAQAIEPACWIALQFAKRVVLAGDHKQLDATVKSDEASKKGLSLSLFERVMRFPQAELFATMLVEQYRMNSLIMEWSSTEMYHGRLVAHPDVSQRVIFDLTTERIEQEGDFSINGPLLFIDTAGALMHEAIEMQVGKNESKFNHGECDLVTQVVKELLGYSLKSEHIGVISPYSAQVNEIRKSLKAHGLSSIKNHIEVSTVDGFQGREKEIIIISMVRSNPGQEIGFLQNERRMNVAVTRAKRLCVLIGDSSTVSKNHFLKSLCDYFKEHGQTRTAFDYQGNPDVRTMYGQKGNAQVEKPLKPQSLKAQAELKEQKETAHMSKAQKKKLKKINKQQDQDDVTEVKKENSYKQQSSNISNQREEDNERRREDILKEIQAFVHSDDKVHKFPTSFNSYERQLVHDIAEQFGLTHESQGQGKTRHVVLTKPKPKELKQKPQTNQQKSKEYLLEEHEKCLKDRKHLQTLDQNFVFDLYKVLPDLRDFSLNSVAKRISNPHAVYSMYLSYKEKEARKQQQPEEVKVQTKPAGLAEYAAKRREMEEKKAEEKRQKEQQLKDLDDDAFLDSVISENRQCSHSQCTTTITSFQYCTCRNCKKPYCSSHVQPLNHSCTDREVKSTIGFASDGPQYAQKATAATRAKAKQAIKEMELKRMAKPSKNEAQKATTQKKKK